MGCGASASSKHDYSDDVGPDGPLSAAPAQLIVSGHKDVIYNGIYTRGNEAWNDKAVYRNQLGRVIYYYDAKDGGEAGWSFDNRDQPDTKGAKDWYHGGFLSIGAIPGMTGPAFPPLSAGVELNDTEDGEDGGRVSIFEVPVAPPPAALRISGHPNDEANLTYALAADLWNGRPHYKSSKGWHFYYYAANEGGQCGWALHPDDECVGGQKDECDGGWVGPYNWSHPPVGPSVGFNDVGRCAVVGSVALEEGDYDKVANVQSLLMQYRQGQMTMLGMSDSFVNRAQTTMQPPADFVIAQPVVPTVVAQPVVVVQQQPAIAVAQPVMAAVVPLGEAVAQ